MGKNSAETTEDIPGYLAGELPMEAYEDIQGGQMPPQEPESFAGINRSIRVAEANNWGGGSVWIEGGTTLTIEGQRVKIDPKSYHNMKNIILNHPDIRDCFAYDIFADEVKVVKCPPWENPDKFIVRRSADGDISDLIDWFECVTSDGKIIQAKDSQADRLIDTLGRRNAVNPPKDYFDRIQWDGIPRLNTWLINYLGAEQQPPEYLAMVGRKWLVGAVTRIYEPGAAFDFAMILQGKQRIGKSKVLERLATINGVRYFTDESINFRSKDSAMLCQGKLIVEMAELASWRRADERDIKAFITRRVDEYRPHYARKHIERKRMFVLAGTVNPVGGEIFSDPTGNTRYWPVICGRIDLDAVDDVKEQLWAEAVACYHNKEQLFLTPKQFRIATKEQDKAMIRDVWEEDIQKALEEIEADNVHADDHCWDSTRGKSSGLYAVNEIMDKMKIPSERKTNVYRNRIRISMELLGYEETFRTKAGKRARYWSKKEITEADLLEDET